MLARFKVAGHSMEPALKAGDLLLINRWARRFSTGDVVVFKDSEGMFFIKRVLAIDGQKIYLVGDNTAQSRDSRDFGWISKKAIVGKVIFSS